MNSAPSVLGIDLGTTNSCLSVWRQGEPKPEIVALPQIIDRGRLTETKTLPSCLYLPHAGEFEPHDLRLPWQEQGNNKAVVGALAKERGAMVPERVITSAKSWLCHAGVDRAAPILPWRSDLPEGKLSPVAASRAYLEHLLKAYRHQAASRNGDGLVPETTVLTIPASFDEAARELTLIAAREAGLNHPILLEEPLAAFYAWLENRADDWRNIIRPGQLVLVVDVGGGTTDFSLIAVTEKAGGELALERISVGEHLLLGGDNMDLSLAYALRQQLETEGKSLDHWQFLSLVSMARNAKERLFSEPQLSAVPIAVASRSASLFQSTIATGLSRTLLEQVLLEGFFPETSSEDRPRGRRGIGIQELGLHYESDPAITRHLARFLAQSKINATNNPNLKHLLSAHPRLRDTGQLLLPDAVLFNGGVFHASLLKARVLGQLERWSQGSPITELSGNNPDLAVATGAACYARLHATGQGVRVRSGTARSYYVGVEASMPAVPGIEPLVHGLCVVPQGTEEGSELALPDASFGVLVGEPTEFRFFSSTTRPEDGAGFVVQNAPKELLETAKLKATLPPGDYQAGEVVPVQITALVTNISTIELYIQDLKAAGRWRLALDFRNHEQGP